MGLLGVALGTGEPGDSAAGASNKTHGAAASPPSVGGPVPTWVRGSPGAPRSIGPSGAWRAGSRLLGALRLPRVPRPRASLSLPGPRGPPSRVGARPPGAGRVGQVPRRWHRPAAWRAWAQGRGRRRPPCSWRPGYGGGGHQAGGRRLRAAGGAAGAAMLAGRGLRAGPPGLPVWAAVLRRWVRLRGLGGAPGATPPRVAPETPGLEGGCPRVPYLPRGMGRWAGAWTEEAGRRGTGGARLCARPSASLLPSVASATLAVGLPSQERPLAVGTPTVVCTSVEGHDDTPQRVVGSSRGHWLRQKIVPWTVKGQADVQDPRCRGEGGDRVCGRAGGRPASEGTRAAPAWARLPVVSGSESQGPGMGQSNLRPRGQGQAGQAGRRRLWRPRDRSCSQEGGTRGRTLPLPWGPGIRGDLEWQKAGPGMGVHPVSLGPWLLLVLEVPASTCWPAARGLS